jgi:NAD(P)-dependent dehydrogenase (short-subunit alcohol dehydrogenase family)
MGNGDKDVDGKVAVVTGGATGIGRATAARLVAGGAAVVICGRREDVIARAVAVLRAEGGRAEGLLADVTLGDDMARIMAFAEERFGGIDILVNNAAAQAMGTVETTDEATWDEVIDASLKGTFLASKHAIPRMRERGGGAIVNVASIHAYATAKGRAAYAAAKSGLLGLTRAMALDHAADGIRVNVVSPGATDTEMLRAGWAATVPDVPVEQGLRDLAARHPLGRLGRPEDLAEMIAFVAGPRAAFVTGAEFRVDGGVLARFSIAPQS